MKAKNNRRQRGRSVILWGLLFLACGQLGLAVFLQEWRPDLRDPEYGVRLSKLRRRLQEAPERPLVLVFGSSRVSNGVAPELMALVEPRCSSEPLVFNLSLSGAGPMMQLLCLKRMLGQGICPQAVVLEAMPVYLDHDGRSVQTKSYMSSDRLHWQDLSTLCRHAPRLALWRCGQWLEWNSMPFFWNRSRLLARYAPAWTTPDQTELVRYWQELIHSCGWIPLPPERVSPERRLQESKGTKEHYQPLLNFTTIDKVTDQVLRETLDLCRERKIGVVGLVMMPESSDFRSWYAPVTRACVSSYLHGLAREYDTQLIDASAWLPDDAFLDGHHLLHHGASEFTGRFWRDVLLPFLEKQNAGS